MVSNLGWRLFRWCCQRLIQYKLYTSGKYTLYDLNGHYQVICSKIALSPSKAFQWSGLDAVQTGITQHQVTMWTETTAFASRIAWNRRCVFPRSAIAALYFSRLHLLGLILRRHSNPPYLPRVWRAAARWMRLSQRPWRWRRKGNSPNKGSSTTKAEG